MSVVLTIKTIVMLYLKESTPRQIKVALLNLCNEVDQDLEDRNYETSSETDEAILYLDKVLAGTLEEEKEREVDADLNSTVQSRRGSSVAPKDPDAP